MKKIIVTEFVSLDGVMEAPGPDGSGFAYAGWTMPYTNEEFMTFKSEELFAAGALLLGRITYDGFAQAWPRMAGQGNAFADKMNAMPKYVVSNSLTSATWENSHIITGNVAEEIKRLKERAEGDLLVCGSGVWVNTLLKEGLADEYRLLVYPVILGTGKKLFTDDEHASFKRIEARPFDSGLVLLRYAA